MRSLRRRAWGTFCSAVWVGGCVTTPPLPRSEPQPLPSDDSIDAVVFLIGDAGVAEPGSSPTLGELRLQVEDWSARLERDAAVRVLFLGDNVYPDGVRERTHRLFARDSLRLWSQADVVHSEQARRFGTLAHFLDGNHDWGEMPAPEGVARLRNEEELLDALREDEGYAVDLLPEAGDPGPVVRDVGQTARLVFLGTQWWLQRQDSARKVRVLDDLRDALRTAGDRRVIVAGHHPFSSGGAHGSPVAVWERLGFVWLLRKTGSMVQDMNSAPYRELARGLRAVFAEAGRPLVFAGGHDHSLQVLEGQNTDEPVWSLISGAGSKLSPVSRAAGMRLGLDRPGFMRLTFLRDGGVLLHVFASEEGPTVCEGSPPRIEQCMLLSMTSFRSVFETRLR